MNDETYNFVRKEEGGYVDDPSDSGGATNRGVTQNTYDLYRKGKKLATRPVRDCTLDETRDIYGQFYESCSADKLADPIALVHFDYAINAGPAKAIRTLQQTVGVKDDGVIGPVTIAAVSKMDITTLIVEYSEARRNNYRWLAEKRPKDMKFLKGWLLRTNRAERAALALIRKV